MVGKTLSWLDTDGCQGMRCEQQVLSTRSDCAVLRSVVLGVLRTPDHITTDALDVSCSACNVLTDWNNTSS